MLAVEISAKREARVSVGAVAGTGGPRCTHLAETYRNATKNNVNNKAAVLVDTAAASPYLA
jgi:hypothetical protein